MKKFIVAVLLVLIVPAIVFAAPIVSGQVGLSVVDNRPMGQTIAAIKDKTYKFDFANVKFGPEVKVDVLFFEFDSTVYAAVDKQEELINVNLSGTETVGVTFDFLNLIKIGAGAGFAYEFNVRNMAFGFEGCQKIGEEGCATFAEAIKAAPIIGKLSVEATLGKFYAGLNAIWNPGISMKGLKKESISFSDVKLGVSVGYSF